MRAKLNSCLKDICSCLLICRVKMIGPEFNKS